MDWSVRIGRKAEKQLRKLPTKVKQAVQFLLQDLSCYGPCPGVVWSHFSKLRGSKNKYHCHILKGRPTYVACWDVVDKEIRLMEIYYVGTHEKAPY